MPAAAASPPPSPAPRRHPDAPPDGTPATPYYGHRGRPTTCTDALTAEIAGYIRQGNRPLAAYALAGTPKRAAAKWYTQGRAHYDRAVLAAAGTGTAEDLGPFLTQTQRLLVTFYLTIEEALAQAQRMHVTNITLSGTGAPAREVRRERVLEDGTVETTVERTAERRPDWKASAWYLERTARAFQKREQHEVTGAGGTALFTLDTLRAVLRDEPEEPETAGE